MSSPTCKLRVHHPKPELLGRMISSRHIVRRFSTTLFGVISEYPDTSHWKLSLGGGDVLCDAPKAVSLKGPCSHAAATKPTSGSKKTTPYSGDQQKMEPQSFEPATDNNVGILCDNLFPPIKGGQRGKHSKLRAELRMSLTSPPNPNDNKLEGVLRAGAAAVKSTKEAHERYNELNHQLGREEKDLAIGALNEKRRLEARRKDIMSSHTSEYANYLVSLSIMEAELEASNRENGRDCA
ncbi:hypothetical protein FOL47_008816 [Perkinsus chesapeaki]|uniref:Uncharacterized protein n=1 Tax=Perkinsus chesapeaki TaxID=330153 RepID=A0A7J6LBW8_PERCH|nr:hypothetical protein FOL47_008816 [Perkinsus chesapeaki]